MRKVTHSLFHEEDEEEDDDDMVNCIIHWEEHQSVNLKSYLNSLFLALCRVLTAQAVQIMSTI